MQSKPPIRGKLGSLGSFWLPFGLPAGPGENKKSTRARDEAPAQLLQGRHFEASLLPGLLEDLGTESESNTRVQPTSGRFITMVSRVTGFCFRGTLFWWVFKGNQKENCFAILGPESFKNTHPNLPNA